MILANIPRHVNSRVNIGAFPLNAKLIEYGCTEKLQYLPSWIDKVDELTVWGPIIYHVDIFKKTQSRVIIC